MARVVLADDHPLFLRALKEAVEQAGITVAGLATRGDELLELLAAVETDAVILDLEMPGYDGFECLGLIRERFPDVLPIVLSGSDAVEDIHHALSAGAICFVGKGTDTIDLAGAIHVLLSGSIHLSPAAATPVAATPDPELSELLTRRELEILRLVSDGRSNAEMARSLWVTEQTVKFHLSNVYKKLGVSNRTAASRWAQERGLLSSDQS